jgi:hypothetical protein
LQHSASTNYATTCLGEGRKRKKKNNNNEEMEITISADRIEG